MTDGEKLNLILSDLQTVKQDLQTVKQDLQIVRQKVTSIELTIENELQPNIMRVAEGHIDLFRNLSDVKSAIELMDGKLEMNDLYIRYHDSEIKKFKAL